MSVESNKESPFDTQKNSKEFNKVKYDEDFIYSDGYYEIVVPYAAP